MEYELVNPSCELFVEIFATVDHEQDYISFYQLIGNTIGDSRNGKIIRKISTEWSVEWFARVRIRLEFRDMFSTERICYTYR